MKHGTATNIILFNGYKRTGKTTLSNNVTTGSFSHTWLVYKQQFDSEYDDHGVEKTQKLFASMVGAPTTAFADGIKNVFLEQHGLPSDYNFDIHKDTTMVDGKLVRQHLIDIGQWGRNIDTAYWMKRALGQYVSSKNCQVPDACGSVVICTDLRFKSELKAIEETFCDVPHTILRIFRSTVPVPDMHIESEHDLDALVTEYLLVPMVTDYKDACTLWPQYSDHLCIGTLESNGFIPCM